jgi:hypothetical protein
MLKLLWTYPLSAGTQFASLLYCVLNPLQPLVQYSLLRT